MKNIEVIHNVRVKDVKVGDRIHQHGGGERTVVATRYIRYSGCPDGVLLVTTAVNASGIYERQSDHYPVISSQVGDGGFYKVPTIVTEAVQS